MSDIDWGEGTPGIEVQAATVEMVPVGDITPAKGNPRADLQPGDREWADIERSIRRLGLVEPLVVNRRSLNIVGGHQRYKVMVHLGAAEVPVVWVDLSAVEEKALNVALNHATGHDEKELLAAWLLDIAETDIELLEVTTFDLGAIDDLQFSPEEADEDAQDFEESEKCPHCGQRLPNGFGGGR